MSDAVAAMGSAAVTTIGTVAVAGMATKAVGKFAGGGGSTRSRGTRTRKSGSYNVWHGTKSKRKSNSMLGF